MTDLALHSNGDHSMCDHPVERQISEELVSVIRARVEATVQSDVAAACLMALADRGVFNMRELPQVALDLYRKYDGDLSQIVGVTIDQFARAAGLPYTTEMRSAFEGGVNADR